MMSSAVRMGILFAAALRMGQSMSADTFEVEFERLRLLTNNFKVIATEDPLTIDPVHPVMLPNELYVVNGRALERTVPEKRPGQYPTYLVDDLRDLGLMDVNFRIRLGDSVVENEKPTLVKSRVVEDDTSVLFPINTQRHYPHQMYRDMNKYDIPLSEKKAKLLWRGATTGRLTTQIRFLLVEKYFSSQKIDVGFSMIVQGEENYTKYVKGKVDWKDMLQYKYLLSLEGNDVASGLKWQLLSNSLVLMPEPTKVTWFLESRLKPYVHYIPINPDLSNIEEQVEWAESHPDECQWITRNASMYAKEIWDFSVRMSKERIRLLKLVLGQPLTDDMVRQQNASS